MSGGNVRHLGEDINMVLPHTSPKVPPCTQTSYLTQALFKREVWRLGEGARRE